ncbi:MAG: DUF4256 domain-containing protein [Bacteroidota bacterium]
MKNTISKNIEAFEKEDFIAQLKQRFMTYIQRHPKIKWENVENRLRKNPEKLKVIFKMESTGGEPDVIGQDIKSGEIIFCDCSEESPLGRRSLCYDVAALDSRKENKPAGNAEDFAKEIGITLLTESEYFQLQELGEFDLKTSSWLKTPDKIRNKGGAIFGDFRFGRVFIYHNGASSYYAARGFRGLISV